MLSSWLLVSSSATAKYPSWCMSSTENPRSVELELDRVNSRMFEILMSFDCFSCRDHVNTPPSANMCYAFTAGMSRTWLQTNVRLRRKNSLENARLASQLIILRILASFLILSFFSPDIVFVGAQDPPRDWRSEAFSARVSLPRAFHIVSALKTQE